MKKKVIKAINEVLKREFVLEKPKDLSFGHYATPIAFSLAKELKKSPMIIADELCHKFKNSTIFKEVTSLKGYINFKLSEEFLNQYATKAISDEDNFAKGDKKGSILLEYVSANPTGPLHIGHARGAVLGDSLYRVGNHLGYKITSEYYVNDAGSQIEMLGLSIYLAGREHILKMDVKWPDEFYRGEYILDLAKEAYEEFGKNIFEDESNIEKLSSWGKDKMIELIKSNLADVGIEFEHFVSEKSLYDKWNDSFLKLEKSGKTYEKDGKVWIASSEAGDEKDRVVVREDKRPTYLAGDIIYHDNKFQRGYDRYINIWGADHHGYIARVKAAIKFLGYDESKLEVILAQMVSLLKGGEPYKMSKRAGNFILMRDVVDEVGANSLRYAFLSKTADIPLKFDINDLNKMDNSNPHFYINYAYSRIKSLLEKSKFNYDEVANTELKNLDINLRELSILALKLPEVFVDSFETRQIFKITEYLKDLASKLHSFYNSSTILGSENEKDILKVLLLVANSIKVGLETLGIKVQERL